MNQFLRPMLGATFALALTSVSAQAATIALWNFESPNPADATAAIYPNAIAPAIGSGNAKGVHASAATAWTTPVGNGSTDSFSSNTWAVGDYYEFSTNTTGFSGINVSWDQTSSNTGPRDFKLAYSTNGTTFTDFFTGITVLANAAPNPTWTSGTVNAVFNFTANLASVIALNNQTNVFFRLIDTSTVSANGGAVAAGGTSRVDNFTISGTSTPVPLPAAVWLLGSALGGISVLRRRAGV